MFFSINPCYPMKKSTEFKFSKHEIDTLFEIDARSRKNTIHIYDVTIIDITEVQ